MTAATSTIASGTLLNRWFSDHDEIEEAIRDWDLQLTRLDCGQLKTHIHQVISGPVLVGDYNFNRKFEQRGASPPGMVTFGLVEPDSVPNWRGNKHSNNSVLIFPGSDEYECTAHPGRLLSISISKGYLGELAETLGVDWRLKQSETTHSISESALTSLLDATRETMHSLFEKPRDPGRAALNQTIQIDIPARLLTILAKDNDRLSRAPSVLRSRVIRIALDHIRLHGREPISIMSLCAITGASWRTIDYAFKERFGFGPKRYQLLYRLNGAMRDLRTAPPQSKVKTIASAWGFWHMSKFANDYRHLFGELPSATLSRKYGR